MRILVTNDDGIHAPGLGVAEKIARALSDDVWVLAPENEQSGASHSLSLSVPLRLRKIAERRFAVSGTPTDCVMMGCLNVLKDSPPDLVLSGVNWGSNLADDVTYSGTIAGAMEGCALGIPAIAMSQEPAENSRTEIDWSAGEVHAPALIRRLIAVGWPKGTLLNMNFPACSAAEVTGVSVVPQGEYDLQSTAIEQRVDVRARAYYWIGLRRHQTIPPEDSDIGAVAAGKIAVTPLHLNLTEHAVLKKMRAALGETVNEKLKRNISR
jgi:5'-nucleotidase